jgi:queuine tRNA-ribosyltransferase
MQFTIEKRLKNSLARAGRIDTVHGSINTPAYVAVGTKASVKGLTTEQLKYCGIQVVLANTYHLYLQPGESVVKDGGGLHKFMHWDRPLMTDSGGFQVYSLGIAYGRDHSKFLSKHDVDEFLKNAPHKDMRERLAKVSEQGVIFKSHIDGSSHTLTPEKSIEIQHDLGADIIFAFDDFVTPTDPYKDHQHATERTHRWAKRSLRKHYELGQGQQALYGIVQGGPHKDLRVASAQTIANMGFDGFGIGGSYTKEEMIDVLKWVCPILPEEYPRHLLGIGEPVQIFSAVEHGSDTFDCVMPTREARNGRLYTAYGAINIFNAVYRQDLESIDYGCTCYTCINYTRAYVAHLFRARELMAFTLASIHNLFFFADLVINIRNSILHNRFFEFRDEFLGKYLSKN